MFLSGKIYNLGPAPRNDVWSIAANRTLQRRDNLAAVPAVVPVADGVINLKAEYGYDADGNGQITDLEWMTALPAPTDWTRVLAVRIAVLVRGRQFERSANSNSTAPSPVTPTARQPTYFGNKSFLMNNVDGNVDGFGDLDADPNNWRYYRYRVYERVIPLRNVLWGVYG